MIRLTVDRNDQSGAAKSPTLKIMHINDVTSLPRARVMIKALIHRHQYKINRFRKTAVPLVSRYPHTGQLMFDISQCPKNIKTVDDYLIA